ncbi:MAG: PIN domain-containing protein [Candidatus Nanopelagicales bacterium]|jgi:predicted nucleic acid-binding protein
MSAFIDTNIIVRHLTGDPADMAARATTFLESASGLLLTDLVLAEAVYVLESFYRVPHAKVAEAMRSLIAFKAVTAVDPALLLRALEVYEVDRLDFAEAYLVASAESSAVNTIVSYDKSIDRVTTVERIEPPAIA